jgi:hypothetical protein
VHACIGMEDVPNNEPRRKKKGRPRSTTSAFALKREEVKERRAVKEANKLSIDGCTPELPKHCRCGVEIDFHGFTPGIIQQVRAYLMRIGKENKAAVRNFMIERAHLNASKATDPSKNLSNVRLYTFHMERPDIIAGRLARVMAEQTHHVHLVRPAPEDLIAVCANSFFFITGKSKDFFYPKNPLKRDRTAVNRTVVAVRERRPQPLRVFTKEYYLLQWVQVEMKRHLNDPAGGEYGDQTFLPYKDKLEAHAYFVIEMEQNVDNWEHGDAASALYFKPDSELMALQNLGDDNVDEVAAAPIVQEIACLMCNLYNCECDQVIVHQEGDGLVPTNLDCRYGNRYLDHKSTLPLHPKVLTYSTFCAKWAHNEEFKKLKLRKWMPFAKCDVCVQHEESRNQPMTQHARRAHVAEFGQHLGFVRRERQAYYHNIRLALSDPDQYMSIILDAADASDYAMPHTKTRSHASSACHKIKMHLMGGLVHGRETFLWTVPPHIAQGHNITIQALHKILCHILKKDGKLPRVLFLQLDNTTKQCKGKGVFGYAAVLVALRIFDKIYISFLPVGHTHEDIDQIFSRVSVHLRARNAPTLAKMHTELRRSVKKYGKKPIVGHWPQVQNTSAFLGDGMCSSWTQDITLYYAFRVQIGTLPQNSGKVIVQARTYPGSEVNDSSDVWRGFQVDQPWVFPFKDTVSHPIPSFTRDRAKMPKQANAQHIVDANKDDSEGYNKSLSDQIASIRKFMVSLPRIFTQSVLDDNERLFTQLGMTDVDFSWPLEEVELLYKSRQADYVADMDRNEELPSILDNSLGYFNPVVEGEEKEEEKQQSQAFRPHCGEQNVDVFKNLKKGGFYFMANAAVSTQFRIVKTIKIDYEEKEDKKYCRGAWVQYWECSTNTPTAVPEDRADEVNAEVDIDIVTDPWHANSKHIVTGHHKNLEFHNIVDFIDTVEMVRWTKSAVNGALQRAKKPLFTKTVWADKGTQLFRIKNTCRNKALGYWASIINQGII